ncbi:hypothetical protein F8G81_09725 [Arthrobacter sp. CDRTa11]|uniref:hypothetical protein n=1 Tax=Arthrobacter sp. CDRTa11 TaxID=2651199 RepID=UPI0022658C70|nr:hypothetical protein [Arthrobacter sp. CDRTa11]UZX02855.1 hypothetical protein F8G81_09725 [Arthrobacter sp. CDRTa11]
MDLRRVNDWTTLLGASIELWQEGQWIAGGFVDAITDDGEILWMQAPAQERKLYEKAEFYEAWVAATEPALHYRLAKGPLVLQG